MKKILESPVSVVIHQNDIYRNTLIKYMHFFGLQTAQYTCFEEAESFLLFDHPQLVCIELSSDHHYNIQLLQNLSCKFPKLFFLGILAQNDPIDQTVKDFLIDVIYLRDDIQQIQTKVLKWAKAVHSHFNIQNSLNKTSGWVDVDVLLSRKTDQINLIPQIITSFKKDTPADLKLLHRAALLQENNLGQIAHKLKGVSANLGAHILSEICKQIEFYSKEGMINHAVNLTDMLDLTHQKTLNELHSITTLHPAVSYEH